MFLNLLEQKEKEAFFELAALMANSDDVLDEKEELMLNLYKKEMDIENYETIGMDLDEILNSFKSKKAKKIVLMELFALIFGDDEFHQEEKDLVKKIKEKFQFSEVEANLCKEWSKTVMSVVEQGKNIMEL